MQKIQLITYFSLILLPSFGQTNGTYPDQFSSYFFNKSLFNAAYIPLTGESEAIVQSKVRSGVYSDISTLAASIQKTIQSDRQWHSGRFIFQNEKEGPYISRPRFYGNYSIRISLNNKWTLFGGAAIGLVNPNYNTPSKVVNTTLPDGALGIILTYKNSLFGVSSNQIFNNSPSSITSIKLNRYYNLHFETTIPIQRRHRF